MHEGKCFRNLERALRLHEGNRFAELEAACCAWQAAEVVEIVASHLIHSIGRRWLRI